MDDGLTPLVAPLGSAQRSLSVSCIISTRPSSSRISGNDGRHHRRLRHHGLIERIPHSHRYRVTPEGHRRALFLTRTHHRLLRDGLAEITAGPANQPKLRAADRAYEAALDDLLTRAGIAA